MAEVMIAQGGGEPPPEDNYDDDKSKDDLVIELSGSEDETEGDEDDEDDEDDLEQALSDILAEQGRKRKRGDHNKESCKGTGGQKAKITRRKKIHRAGKQRKGRGLKYGAAENKFLCELIQRYKPISNPEWQRVCGRLNKRFTNGRGVNSIKRKYIKLAKHQGDTGDKAADQVLALAREAKKAVGQRASIQCNAEDDDSVSTEDDSFVLDPPNRGGNDVSEGTDNDDSSSDAPPLLAVKKTHKKKGKSKGSRRGHGKGGRHHKTPKTLSEVLAQAVKEDHSSSRLTNTMNNMMMMVMMAQFLPMMSAQVNATRLSQDALAAQVGDNSQALRPQPGQGGGGSNDGSSNNDDEDRNDEDNDNDELA